MERSRAAWLCGSVDVGEFVAHEEDLGVLGPGVEGFGGCWGWSVEVEAGEPVLFGVLGGVFAGEVESGVPAESVFLFLSLACDDEVYGVAFLDGVVFEFGHDEVVLYLAGPDDAFAA